MDIETKNTKDAQGNVTSDRTFKADSIEKAANWIDELKEKVERREIRGEVDVAPKPTSASEDDRREYLNYVLSKVPERYAKHRMLLFLRINPYQMTPRGGLYMSKKGICRFLSKELGRMIFEFEVDAIEREALEICKDTISSMREKELPILGNSRF